MTAQNAAVRALVASWRDSDSLDRHACADDLDDLFPDVVPAHGVVHATVRDGDGELHIECRFADGQKFAAVTVDDAHPELAEAIREMLDGEPKAWPNGCRSDPATCIHVFGFDPRVCSRCGWDYRQYGEPPSADEPLVPGSFEVAIWERVPRGGFALRNPKGVKVTHESGLVVMCDSGRSQHINRDRALRGLRAMLEG